MICLQTLSVQITTFGETITINRPDVKKYSPTTNVIVLKILLLTCARPTIKSATFVAFYMKSSRLKLIVAGNNQFTVVINQYRSL